MKANGPLVGKYNLRIKRGDTLSVVMVLRDAVTKDPVNLTGCSYLAQVRQTKDSTTVIAELVINALTPAEGEIEVFMAPEDSAEIPSASLPRAVWDLEVTYADGFVQTMVEGDVELSGDVSRP
jgi:hypothetical protein